MTYHYRLGFAPYVMIPSPIYDNRKDAVARAKAENDCGPYRRRGVKAYPCDAYGHLIYKDKTVSVFA